MNLPEVVQSHAGLIPVYYSAHPGGETDRVIRLGPFRRNVFTTTHRAQPADFAEYEWLIRYATPETWYERPGRGLLKHMATLEASGCEPVDILPLHNPRPVSLETPRVWASAALTTPTDDDIYDCSAGHSVDGEYTGACAQCTDEKSDALDATPLLYCLILSTSQASDPFIHGAHFNGRQIYKLVKCGSREAAAAEAFYASGVNGWNVTFSCVLRVGETWEERSGAAERVNELWNLAEDAESESTIRAFY
ncbi:hypothetical protein BCR34DRAFT_629171 [Clohesyomyces aquaticus]|uniref:Uncharacterized protein n=1 Tax=Clohesyomyces aquaticus TaxID=1231657 RepID=A0A1Y1Y9G0_9PLEO|nr:hypothetical protein BCR34DRAFT_629171 [Clohesyomyces aquaticus]